MGRISNSLDAYRDAVPEAERRPILLRAYAEVPYEKQRTKAPTTPEFVLVFGTETTPDESQQLRFGTYQLLRKGELREKGLFYDKVTSPELETLRSEARKHGCAEPLSVFDFVHKRFLPTAFKAGGLVVGFNLPFDLSRLAMRHAAARVGHDRRALLKRLQPTRRSRKRTARWSAGSRFSCRRSTISHSWYQASQQPLCVLQVR